MRESIERIVADVCGSLAHDSGRLLDIVRGVQHRLAHVPDEAVDAIARHTGVKQSTVAGVVSFYSFFSAEQQGRIVIRLCDDVVDRMAGYDAVRAAFEAELGIAVGATTPDGAISLARTACIGLCDQAPSALIDEVPVTRLTPEKARRIVAALRSHGDPRELVDPVGDGANAHPLVHAMVENNIRRAGPVVLGPVSRGEAISKALALSPVEVIRAVKTARLRGRGGAGFPAGMKWDFARAAKGDRKVIFCNGDEGEPGTFKDRVILTERPDRVFAGMTIAGYATGASEGVLYLRAEYAYLAPYLEDVLERRRADHLLGAGIRGRNSLDFDIRIQLGAGSYVCGEETALLTSCEGRAGEPKTRPPYPVQSGYFGHPSVVNNVETFACVTKILEHGPAAFSEHGTSVSSGTKLLSIAGDCRRPGVYEVPMGITLGEVLDQSGAGTPQAVLVGGPSGHFVGPDALDRAICFEDLATGGALTVFGPERDLLAIASEYMAFFVEESCGYCTPCRVGNVLLKERLDTLRRGRGEPADLEYLEQLGRMVKSTSRCGLGQTSPNPILTTLTSFRSLYEDKVKPDPDGFKRSFDLAASVATAERLAQRQPAHETERADG